MHYLITGGCGFIGSHLADDLVRQKHEVTVLDDLSTGRFANVIHLEGKSNFHVLIGSVIDSNLVREVVRNCDAVFHLASAVGVRLIMEHPVDTIDTIFMGTHVVLKEANRYRKPVVITSTSEVYGKSTNVPFQEDGDRLAGATTKHRWAYACAKALDEFLALAYWKSTRLPVVVVRLFNTVGPRQTGHYGMVLPNFVEQALSGSPLMVHGDGEQTRCFCHVTDVVNGLVALINCREAYGQVVNLGSTEEVSILQLAERIKTATNSQSPIKHVSYESVYGSDFEDMQRRVPSIEKASQLVGWTPRRDLERVVADVIDYFQSKKDMNLES